MGGQDSIPGVRQESDRTVTIGVGPLWAALDTTVAIAFYAAIGVATDVVVQILNGDLELSPPTPIGATWMVTLLAFAWAVQFGASAARRLVLSAEGVAVYGILGHRRTIWWSHLAGVTTTGRNAIALQPVVGAWSIVHLGLLLPDRHRAQKAALIHRWWAAQLESADPGSLPISSGGAGTAT